MRLIDADALMQRYDLNKAIKYGNESEEQVDFSYSTIMMYEIAGMIEDAPTVEIISDNWISTKDRLPKYYEYVLICYSKQQDITIAWLAEDTGHFEDDDCKYYMSEVTHWMPLPKPPKEA